MLGVEHLVAERVQHPRDTGAHAARAQDRAVHLRCRRNRRLRHAGPLAGEGAVEQAGEVDLVDLGASGGQPAQRRVDAEADQAHLSVLVDEHVLRRQAAVRQPGVVRLREAVGDLADQPRGPSGSQRPLPADQDVERLALAPLVDDVAAAVGELGVEHPEQPPVDDRAGASCGLEEGRGALVVAGQQVHRHRTVQDEVVGTPEAASSALGEEVVEPVAAGEHVTGLHRCRHAHLAPSRPASGPRRSPTLGSLIRAAAAPRRCRPGW